MVCLEGVILGDVSFAGLIGNAVVAVVAVGGSGVRLGVQLVPEAPHDDSLHFRDTVFKAIGSSSCLLICHPYVYHIARENRKHARQSGLC